MERTQCDALVILSEITAAPPGAVEYEEGGCFAWFSVGWVDGHEHLLSIQRPICVTVGVSSNAD